jgi:filamentous hemagglutinin
MDPRLRLPENFKTFDFFDRGTSTAISAKTLNTQTAARLSDPKKIYQSLKKNIDKTLTFKEGRLSGEVLKSHQIKAKKLEVAIPSGTNRIQLQQIEKAVKYAKQNNVQVNITVVK